MWSVTGQMTKPRAGHYAFILPTGAILVVGGDPCCDSNITAELYDPGTGSWSSAGSPGPTVNLYAATMLKSNNVFITGGWVYDPIRRTWSQTHRDPVYRQGPDAALLSNGDVLIVGGTNDPDEVVITPGAELYDPVTGAWRMTSSPNVLREWGTNTVLPDGSVFAAGGFSWVTQVDEYSRTTYPVPMRSSVSYGADEIWQPSGDLNEARCCHTATLMPDGRVLVAGGEALQYQENASRTYASLRSAELYDPRNATWTNTAPLTIAPAWHTATLLKDGSVLVVGGLGGRWSAGSAVLGSAERYFLDFNAAQ